jgi:membrane fusion protein (multidrug efflux system)
LRFSRRENSGRTMHTAAAARPSKLLAAVVALAMLSACGKAAPKKAAPPVEVGYVAVKPTTVVLTQDFSGRAVAYQSSEVRPQVSGVIKRLLFTEGGLVRAGQPLYQIDDSLYRAAVNQAQANLASAQASKAAADTLVQRYTPLAQIEAISGQDLTNATASARQAAASVQQAAAALDTARINLRFATVPAPISGRIGLSAFTVGALVTASQTAPLTTIQQLDPIYIDVQQSSADLTRLRKAISGGDVQATTAAASIQLEDGSPYPHKGVVQFSQVVVDPTTSTVTLRIRVPNPEGLILPGMFLKASFAQAQVASAYLVPQTAISRDPSGAATLRLVSPDGKKAVTRTVTADRTQGNSWVVTEGLNPGDKVITQGLGVLRPTSTIHAVPESAPQGARKRGVGAGGKKPASAAAS